MSNQDQTLDECGCCEGVERLTPASVENLPGLAALAYRVGTHGSFKATMQADLSSDGPLRDLTTREDDDPSIALLDGWAAVLDVLSFYQERIANEGFLRTAIERRSILEMARSIGYELRPGVAAGTYLAFTMETATGSPASVQVPVGTKAQSTPAQDEKPQIFETVEQIEARGAWNELKPKIRQFIAPALGKKTLYLKGTATNLKAGDALLIIGDERVKDSGSENWDFRRVSSVETVALTDADSSYTVVTLNEGFGSFVPHVEPAKQNPKVYALRQRASLFGYNAPDWRAMPESLKAGYLGLDPSNASTLHANLQNFTEWPNFNVAWISDPPPRTAKGTGLYGEYYNTADFKQRAAVRTDAAIDFDWGTGKPHPSVDSDTFSVRWTGWIQAKVSGFHTFYVLADDGVRLWIDGQLLIDQWKVQAATEFTSATTVRLAEGEKHDIKLEYFENTGAATVKLSWSAQGMAKEVIPQTQLFPRDIYDIHLDAIYSQIVLESWVVLSIPEYQEVYKVTEVADDARSNFTLSAKTTRLKLQGEHLHELFNERIRDTVVFEQSELLEWADAPITTPVSGTSVVLSTSVDGLFSGQTVAISGTDYNTGEALNEIAFIDRTEIDGKNTKLVFKSKLENTYVRDSVVINANIARATHGESKKEVLGSGDGSQVFQKFVLKQTPLTYVSAATASGAESTLEVRVNDVLWDEAPAFYQLAPDRKAIVTRLADDGKVTIQFGDGITGARVPTGVENIAATYRVGIGLDAMLAADQINLLMSRPLGLKSVTNPLAPTGAADPEQLDDARENAPLTVLTLDRIVSLRDFEDFARAFSGIGKAQAAWLWNGEKRMVHLTVAGVDGGDVPVTSDLFKNLKAAIDSARHADQRVRVDSYRQREFNLAAKLLIDPHYLFDDVKTDVEAALTEAFSFDTRAFGQAVTSSEVIALAQSIDGVVAVDLDQFWFADETPKLNQRLPANVAHWQGDVIQPADLLTVSADGISLTEMK